jgi:dinuclear metal center YbgI/SA1388 family protein
MIAADLEAVLEKLAPRALAEPEDNCGLLVGDRDAPVGRVLVALELTEPVLAEAVAGSYDAVLTHHPLLFSPLRSVVESRPRERMVRELVRGNMNLFANHTNLDSSEGGLGSIAAEALGLTDAVPLRRSPAGWSKFVGFVPLEAAEKVAAAVFAAGAGSIGEYEGCAFSGEGKGWFTPGPDAHPAVGQLSIPERASEIRWETVVPRNRLGAVITAYVAAHPYEEPAFDVYPVDDVHSRAGLGRVGTLTRPVALAELAGRVAKLFELTTCTWSGDGARLVRRVAVVPGSGRSLMSEAAGVDVLITGDLGYHDAERAADSEMAVIDAPHGELEWSCMRRWVETLRAELAGSGVEVDTSKTWRSPWNSAGEAAPPAARPAPKTMASSVSVDQSKTAPTAVASQARPATPEAVASPGVSPSVDGAAAPRRLRLRVDGGSRGNPGPGAVGAVLEDENGQIVDSLGRTIGVCTNNVAEYKALLAGLELAAKAGAEYLEILADSELLVKQVRGEYKVKNEGLKPLHREAVERLRQFPRAAIRHVPRAQNAEADRLVNKALDEAAATSL